MSFLTCNPAPFDQLKTDMALIKNNNNNNNNK